MKSLLLLIILFGIYITLNGFIVFLLYRDFDSLQLGSFSAALSVFFLIVYMRMKWDNDFIYLFIKTRLKRGSQKMRSAKEKMKKELEDE